LIARHGQLPLLLELLASADALRGTLASAIAEARREELLVEIFAFLEGNPGATGRALRAAFGGSHTILAGVLHSARDRGILRSERGDGNAEHWFVVLSPPSGGPASGPGIRKAAG
jgi:hypothetical protein